MSQDDDLREVNELLDLWAAAPVEESTHVGPVLPIVLGIVIFALLLVMAR